VPYVDMQVLWIDDHPDRNVEFVERLQNRGARVWVFADRRRAENLLGATRIDLLISDVQRGIDREAGLKDLADWRSRGVYLGPAVFFSSRVTPSRAARARELDARFATSEEMLHRYFDETWAASRHASS
jgi:CheY-like chemotaxis protein